ncbi:tRNA (5-methylaminomethyl-2-thiouridine)(34)-methyltransferase MnmD [Bacteroides sp. 51]|uniref:tRNA (5-methylaminomethyl-2-thiouridine)(34)-methyltransferase MnmD n=1 Tax=Bacteroides sp. 51 TaxID=2302938 RepID=UPI0013D66F73|nr:tRNA (5-methylaminomethyl-2-thiouridine)(34)-methyltransferase MnmD [Bacteroides sp. 51]NDV80661.1 SAM-dependent methyltransferase [Bacteroides sp. 51]
MKRIIEHTDDGSATLYVPEMNEHYHSVKGARTESQHIFIDMGLKHVQTAQPHVLEIGFGTGLNAYLTLLAANETGKKVHYTGLELYPLEWDMIAELNYSDDPLFKQIHTAAWEEEVEISPNFTLQKKKTDFTTIHKENHPHRYDVVYFDAFAPEKQPEMWEQQLFNHIYSITNSGGVLTTYCAKGSIRRMLQAAGFVVERLPGPPGGKREILRGSNVPLQSI